MLVIYVLIYVIFPYKLKNVNIINLDIRCYWLFWGGGVSIARSTIFPHFPLLYATVRLGNHMWLHI